MVDDTFGAGGVAAVVKLHEYGLDMDCPLELVAPLTVAVYVVLYARAAEGVKVETVPELSNVVEPPTAAPAASFIANVTDEAVTGSLKVAVTGIPTATPEAPELGVVVVTAGAGGGAAVVKLQEWGAVMAWPVGLVAPLTVAVYVVL